MSRNRRVLVPLALLAALLVPFPVTAAEPSKEVRKTIPLPAGGRVEIETFKGSVVVTAEERPDLLVEARVTPDTSCGDAETQAEWVEQTEVRIESHDRGVRIESDYDRLAPFHHGFFSSCTARPFVDYRIRIPRKTDLELKDYKSKVSITGLAGDLRLETYKGTMSVRGLNGSVRLTTYKGEAAVDFASLRSDSRFETYKGEIDVSLPKGSAFDLDADSGRRGDFRSDFDGRIRSTGRTRMVLNGGGPRLALSTHRGTLKLSARETSVP
jgi:hypothetical protein